MDSLKTFLPFYLVLCVALGAASAQESPSDPTQSSQIVEQQYNAGLNALKAGNWTKAIIAFQKVQAFDPDYRDVQSLMKKAKRGLEGDSSFDLVARYYDKGLAALQQGNYSEARKYLEKVLALNRDYRDTESRLAEIKRLLQPKLKVKTPATPAADSLYAQAVELMADEEWQKAASLLRQIQSMHPAYHETESLLAKANLQAGDKTEQPSFLERHVLGGNLYYYLGGFAGFIFALPFLAMGFSPTLRARVYYLRGKHLKAAQLYERVLLRHPERLQLYPQLANIYLITGQTDEQAIKVFKTVLQLQLARENQERINDIVAQYYLAEGKTNSEAIEVLEKALKDEQNKDNPQH